MQALLKGVRQALAALVPLLLFAAPLWGQVDEELRAKIDKYVKHATVGSAVVRPQAAQRLVGLGAPAAARLLELCGEGPDELAELGKDLVEVLAEFDDEELEARLWQALADRDFPWRPSAARSLSRAAQTDDLERFAAMLTDPIAAVRAAGVEALGALDAHAQEPGLRAALGDPSDRVRRAAAALLVQWGHPEALAWLLEDLRREDRFFERDTGKTARFESLRALRELLGEELSFRADLDPTAEENAAALERIAALCAERWGDAEPRLPELARAGGRDLRAFFGLELRSCRRGEYFLRFGQADELWIGEGNPARVQLPEGSAEGLRALVADQLAALGEQRLWGQLGCDGEVYSWLGEPEGRVQTLLVSKGQRTVEGLRPEPLGRIAAALLPLLPEDGEDPRLVDLRARLAEALVSVGGSLPAE